MPLSRKNVYGVVGIAAIALLWTALVGILGGVVVVVLVVVLVLVINRAKRKEPSQEKNAAASPGRAGEESEGS